VGGGALLVHRFASRGLRCCIALLRLGRIASQPVERNAQSSDGTGLGLHCMGGSARASQSDATSNAEGGGGRALRSNATSGPCPPLHPMHPIRMQGMHETGLGQGPLSETPLGLHCKAMQKGVGAVHCEAMQPQAPARPTYEPGHPALSLNGWELGDL
jgi:hypothetical protein